MARIRQTAGAKFRISAAVCLCYVLLAVESGDRYIRVGVEAKVKRSNDE